MHRLSTLLPTSQLHVWQAYEYLARLYQTNYSAILLFRQFIMSNSLSPRYRVDSSTCALEAESDPSFFYLPLLPSSGETELMREMGMT